MENIGDLQSSSPNTHVSGLEFTSTSTVGVHTNNTIKSATLKFTKNIFVLFLISFVLNITIGTITLPTTPKHIITIHKTIDVVLIYAGNTG